MRRFSIFTISLLLSIANLYAQDGAAVDSTAAKPKKEKKFKVKKEVKKANRMVTRGDIYAASDLYEVIMTHDPENITTAYKLAESYRIARDYKKAEDWYFKVTEMDPVTYSHAFYWYGLMLKMNAKYEAAKKVFDDFQKSYKGEDTKLKAWAKTESDGCKLALKLKDEEPMSVNITHLNDKVNSAYTDVSPMMWDDTTFLFATFPTDTVVSDTVDHYIKFYRSTVKARNDYEEARIFDKFNEPGFHVGNGAFSPDRKRFYFTKCAPGKSGNIICAIFVSQYKDTAWTTPEEVGGDVNIAGFTSTHPCITPGKKGYETLYFAANREEGGKGGTDIWFTSYNIKKNTYSEPKNAGSKINSERNEATPFFDAATGALYFSSEGLVGVGGYDVFKAEGNSAKWEEPVNIGYPINSSADDMYFKIAEDGNAGYFVSNRPGIISIRSETCCDDIFKFEYFTIRRLAVQGFVYEEDGISKDPIENAKVNLSFESGDIAQNIQIGEDTIVNGKPYFFGLNYEKKYRVSGSAEGFLTNSVAFNTNGIEGDDTLHVDIYLKRLIIDKVYRLRHIFYDFDKWDLRQHSTNQLDTLYNLMVENPTIVVEIGSHTDTRGTDQYNLNLSQKRAESCVNYLIGRGIPTERLIAKGYGETRLLEDCSQYPECPEDNSSDCPCHQNNRRTEFRIPEIGIEVIYEDRRYGDEETQE